jgi:hypothetical protein
MSYTQRCYLWHAAQHDGADICNLAVCSRCVVVAHSDCLRTCPSKGLLAPLALTTASSLICPSPCFTLSLQDGDRGRRAATRSRCVGKTTTRCLIGRSCRCGRGGLLVRLLVAVSQSVGAAKCAACNLWPDCKGRWVVCRRLLQAEGEQRSHQTDACAWVLRLLVVLTMLKCWCA